jgi:hypothetical protein
MDDADDSERPLVAGVSDQVGEDRPEPNPWILRKILANMAG